MTTEQQDALDDERPYAEVRRVGRYRYAVQIVHNVAPNRVRADPWVKFGRERAYAKGRKELKKYVKWLNRVSEKGRIDLE